MALEVYYSLVTLQSRVPSLVVVKIRNDINQTIQTGLAVLLCLARHIGLGRKNSIIVYKIKSL